MGEQLNKELKGCFQLKAKPKNKSHQNCLQKKDPWPTTTTIQNAQQNHEKTKVNWKLEFGVDLLEDHIYEVPTRKLNVSSEDWQI